MHVRNLYVSNDHVLSIHIDSLASEWKHYVDGLNHNGIILSNKEEQLDWSWNEASRQVSPKLLSL